MRCLTLATALRERGAECHFICREHSGNLIDKIHKSGFTATALAAGDPEFQPRARADEPLPAHAAWLGTDWPVDAEATRRVLRPQVPDWLVVDHYALDRGW
ncbi:MAG: UDP-2,4-diacetamido-2,4,6-trideoxy-beta-L-altropyranose hydrolase, partial [Gammaproteobacteria bacterium]